MTFYPLDHDEFLTLNSYLKDAEIRTYLYLMTLNPFPDSSMEIDTSRISEQLGLTRRTVQRAVKRLQELGFIEIEILMSFKTILMSFKTILMSFKTILMSFKTILMSPAHALNSYTARILKSLILFRLIQTL
jgi:biotin operon repressor